MDAGIGTSLLAAASNTLLCVWEVCCLPPSPPTTPIERQLHLPTANAGVRGARFSPCHGQLVLCVGSEAWVVDCSPSNNHFPSALRLRARLCAHVASLCGACFAGEYWRCLLPDPARSDTLLLLCSDRTFSLWRLQHAETSPSPTPAAAAIPPLFSAPALVTETERSSPSPPRALLQAGPNPVARTLCKCLCLCSAVVSLPLPQPLRFRVELCLSPLIR